jgi:hypothetical protein
MPFPDALALADSALRQELVDRQTLANLAASANGPGSPAIRRVLAAADGRSASIGESFTRAAALDAGLPAPELQYPLSFPNGPAAYIDLAWRWFRGREVCLAVEFDGRTSHGSAGAFVADRRRRNRIESIGWGLLEITMTHVTREYRRTGALMATTLHTRWRNAH